MNIDLIDLIGDLTPEGTLSIALEVDPKQDVWPDSPAVADYENFQRATIEVLREQEHAALQSLKHSLSLLLSPQHIQ
ncbi:MAG: hypothetical protein AAF892_16000, partial [Cyanobacteria bacterium P01_D01_bin.71]